ncbi:hypothetical protein [Streptomyces spiramyceticus]|uniref:hypothetical protein n=1 Tax=Streptomyces spiramyceticus TaxID=299717 RepID=UPI00237A18BE|nr:hypothetical protein [Streptomyces spiramyceticus]
MNPHRKIRSSVSLPVLSRPAQGGLTAAALVLIPLIATLGSDSLRAALDFTTGVLSLVSLTAAVGWGLLATDRLLLQPRHRLLAQGIHRATAVASLGFLLLHVTVKVSLGHVALLGALVPFGLGISGTSGLIGFGSLAGILMVVAASTGALRSAFATPGRIAGRWRALHMVAYPAWGSALVHGLFAGRPAAGWVVTMYGLSLTAVVAALSLRMLPPPLKRTVADRIVALVTSGSLAQAPDPEPRDAALSPLPGAGAVPPQKPERAPRQSEQLFRDPPEPQRLAAPAPPLYEAGLPGSPGLNSAPDTGISAAYRAVSAASAGSAPTERIPLAEQIPMTEEIPVQPAPPSAGPAPSRWPTPSPPPPAQAVRPPYDPDRAAYGPGAVPAPDYPAYSPGDYPAPDTPPYDPVAAPVPGAPSYGAEAPTGPLTGPLDDTEPAPGPLYRPAAGEPWHAPAGERR